MDGMLRHVGILKNTQKRILIVMHQIPGQNETALVTDMEALPPRYHDAIESLLKTPEAQNSKDFYEVLARRLLPDEGRPFINCLHERGYLMPTSIDNVVVMPKPNVTINLRQLLELMQRQTTPQQPQIVDPVSNETIDIAAMEAALNNETPAAEEKFNSFTHNREVAVAESQISIAKGILLEAQMLEQEAALKRKKAYHMAPSLDPLSALKKEPVAKTTSTANLLIEEPKKVVKAEKVKKTSKKDAA